MTTKYSPSGAILSALGNVGFSIVDQDCVTLDFAV